MPIRILECVFVGFPVNEMRHTAWLRFWPRFWRYFHCELFCASHMSLTLSTHCWGTWMCSSPLSLETIWGKCACKYLSSVIIIWLIVMLFSSCGCLWWFNGTAFSFFWIADVHGACVYRVRLVVYSLSTVGSASTILLFSLSLICLLAALFLCRLTRVAKSCW